MPPDEGKFIGYVGDADVHDATIVSVTTLRSGDLAVAMKTYDDKPLTVTFWNPVRVLSNAPEGMFVYSLTEMSTNDSSRRFVFANSEDESPSTLEVYARGFEIARRPAAPGK